MISILLVGRSLDTNGWSLGMPARIDDNFSLVLESENELVDFLRICLVRDLPVFLLMKLTGL